MLGEPTACTRVARFSSRTCASAYSDRLLQSLTPLKGPYRMRLRHKLRLRPACMRAPKRLYRRATMLTEPLQVLKSRGAALSVRGYVLENVLQALDAQGSTPCARKRALRSPVKTLGRKVQLPAPGRDLMQALESRDSAPCARERTQERQKFD